MASFVEPVDPTKLIVKLNPMQIRTFRLNLNDNLRSFTDRQD